MPIRIPAVHPEELWAFFAVTLTTVCGLYFLARLVLSGTHRQDASRLPEGTYHRILIPILSEATPPGDLVELASQLVDSAGAIILCGLTEVPRALAIDAPDWDGDSALELHLQRWRQNQSAEGLSITVENRRCRDIGEELIRCVDRLQADAVLLLLDGTMAASKTDRLAQRLACDTILFK